ncbi:cytokinin hydroxylase-like [Papaver somniferum]|uniref:cytokinin hydroxylase-like n=1 Tax=Papaver somniferum TaxID=3469 RepID=UPI000E6FD145|nr:cytokinin hydroxylase-like [Papaver somniferum]
MDFAELYKRSIVVQGVVSAVGILILGSVVTVIYSCWISPVLAHQKLKKNGFKGPPPCFPLGNISDMRKKVAHKKSKVLPSDNHHQSLEITHDIHPIVFPYFSRWSRLYGKVFIYWLGTEPFVYVSDPEFVKQMSSGVMGKSWGKPRVFKDDRKPMFGNHGLLMVEGQDWVHHRHIITPALSPSNLKAMANAMVDSATIMLDQWSNMLDSNNNKHEIDVENNITKMTAEIIARTSFGSNIVNDDNGRKVFEKLRAMQLALFKSTRLVGVPFSKFIYQNQTQEAKKLGQEIDEILVSIIQSRKESIGNNNDHGKDLLGIMLHDNSKNKKLSVEELVDECKTLFFSGHETTALALTWTLFLLALHPEWQNHLREEIKQVIGEGELLLNDLTNIRKLKKMGWLMNEVLRLYSAAPNVQRQAREDIQVGELIIPSGTNIWVDLVGMNHDSDLWGNDVNEFKPERFKDDTLHGGCKHKMGYLPFGFGGRMCIGRNLTIMEYKIVLILLLTRFTFTLSPSYIHSPAIMLSLRPTNGLPLIVQHV